MLAVHEMTEDKVHDRGWEATLKVDLRDLDIVDDWLAIFF